MKLVVDQNANHQSIQTLSGFFAGHTFDHAYDLGWGELADVDLFRAMRERSYDAILTRDRNQLRVPEEKQALAECGLHWIGFNSGKEGGLVGLALETSTILSGLPHVLALLPAPPSAFHLKRVPGEAGQRVRVSRL